MAEAAGRIVMIKRNLEKFKKARAFSPETAVRAEEVGIESIYVLKDLIRWENLRATTDGRYYIECKDKTQCTSK